MSADLLRTPEARFAELPGYPFDPHYLEDLAGIEGTRLHYIDEGPADAGRVFLCLHGNPSWSYLYRKMIPVFTTAGHRAVAPDLPGFGKSDKPVDDAVHTFSYHRNVLLAFIERLDLKNITLMCQDWGGLLGLTLPMDLPDRFTGLLIMNTALTTGDEPLSKGFIAWRDWSNTQDDLEVPKLFTRMAPHLSAEEYAAYGAPFPDKRYKAVLRRFPNIVPENPDDDGATLSRQARAFWKNDWTGQTFMAIGMQDPVMGPATMTALQALIRNCPPAYEVADGGHMIPEWGEDIAQKALAAFGR
ncbi:MAG: haloalkane dehalogenase [Proteobacteria bacterium]|nr:haloalkane dehalogenase [Pseudomonadota bacterium]